MARVPICYPKRLSCAFGNFRFYYQSFCVFVGHSYLVFLRKLCVSLCLLVAITFTLCCLKGLKSGSPAKPFTSILWCKYTALNDVCDPDVLNRCLVKSCWRVWIRELAQDIDGNFILWGITKGFRIVSDFSQVPSTKSLNWKCALKSAAKQQLNLFFHDELR